MLKIEKNAFKTEEEFLQVYHLLKKGVGERYADFNTWFFKNYKNPTKERKVYTAVNENELVGVCLVKENKEETKICTLFVKEKARRSRVASDLISVALKEMPNAKSVVASCNKSLEGSVGNFLVKMGFEKIKEVSGESSLSEIEVFFELKR